MTLDTATLKDILPLKMSASAPQPDPAGFELPPEREAHEPPEARGLARDEVRLLVSRLADDSLAHARFADLDQYLDEGDLLVINTSGTLNAAVPARGADGESRLLHLSTRLPGELWTVEVRTPDQTASQPFFDAVPGSLYSLPGGGAARLLTPYRPELRGPAAGPARLWIATLDLPARLSDYLSEYGHPIRYSYVPSAWPARFYQTVYATEAGSAEMPSAGRAFTPELITRLIARGVQIAPLVLHTGVASLEDHEPPYEEFFRVTAATAERVNAARRAGRRVIAVGTTVVRALETVADAGGSAHPAEGWTDLIVTPDREMRVVTGLLTGFHEPRSSHLAMLEALAGRDHLRLTYNAALNHEYLWHEFGDLHLIIP